MNKIQPDTDKPTLKVFQYIAILNQTGTAAPIPTVLLNTGNLDITWTRDDAGQYTATLNDYDSLLNFDIKTCTTITCQQSTQDKQVFIGANDFRVFLNTKTPTTYVDDALVYAAFELKLYTDHANFT